MLRRSCLRPPPRHRGRGRTLGRIGDVDPYGPSRKATFYVGLERGKEPQNRSPRCERVRSPIAPQTADDVFLELRQRQVGMENVGGTRRKGRGWYQGSSEDSLSYEVVFIPNNREKNYRTFLKNMRRLAEGMAHGLCQDSVILVADNGDKRTVEGAYCPTPRSCWPQRR